MQTSNSTHNSRVTLTQACSFFCAIAMSFFAVSCGKKMTPVTLEDQGSKVVNSDLQWNERALKGLKIHSILSNGQVLLTGDAWHGLPLWGDDLKLMTGSKGDVILLLEGKASVGDSVILTTYIERQELASGEIRVVRRNHYGIKSIRFKG